MNIAMTDAVDTRPAVQAILTADTLIQHYARAVELVRTSLGRDDVEMDAQIADANRTYPTIWEQLDFARGALAAEGADTSQFDRVRAAVGGDTILGVDTERSEITEGSSLFGSAYYEQTLTLRFNLNGVNLAHRASATLKQAMPDVDWENLRRQSAAPVADLTSGSQKWWVLAGLIAAAAITALLVLR